MGLARIALPGAKIALVIDRLGCGGSERQFVALARGLHERGHSIVALVFYAGGTFESELRAAGVPVRILDKRSRWDLWRFGQSLARVARAEHPHVLYGFATVPNVALALIRPLLPDTRVIWGVRATNLPLARYGKLPPIVSRVAARLSSRADLVISNSHAGLADALGRGYRPRQATVIPNGIDTERFAPCPGRGARLRSQWNVGARDTLVGVVGRLDPMKGHPVFLEAAARLASDRPNLRFVCVGDGSAAYRAHLMALATGLGIGDLVRWVATTSDVPAVYNALDVVCSCSVYGEGFPNVVGEAMACGTPCVVTDVGDSARVLNCPALTVPRGRPDVLAARMATLLDMPERQRATLAAEARRRIVSEFSVAHLVDATEEAIARTLSGLQDR